MRTTFKVLLGFIILLFLIIYYIFFYAPKVHFTDDDLIWFNVYNVGDTLIFQKIETKETDTSIITKKEIRNYNYDWLRHDGYRPASVDVFYKNKALKYSGEYQASIIAREKRNPNDSVIIGISYLYSVFDVKNSELTFDNIILTITPKTFEHVYVFKNEKHSRHTKKDDFEPQKLYWDEQYGIIKYETYGREVWERINW